MVPWGKQKHAELEPPSRESLAQVAAVMLNCDANAVGIVFQRWTLAMRTSVVVHLGDSSAVEFVADVELTGLKTYDRIAVWTQAARTAAQRLKAQRDAFAAAQVTQTVTQVASMYMVTSSCYFSGTSYGNSGMFGSSDPYDHGYVGPPVYVNPRLPKVGDLVRDEDGRVVGMMSDNGRIVVVDDTLSAAVAAIERDGVPVEPAVIRRAIDLSFGAKK